ncbi:beta-fructofuranosidase [Aureococcus anophagefferens]|nr:beta-fructofuranosidase [Aureococcus anophagefferens]
MGCLMLRQLLCCAALRRGLAQGDAYARRMQPRYHVAPERNWLNDPNGLAQVDGVYHVFFQHNERAPTWGNICAAFPEDATLTRWVRAVENPVVAAPPPGVPGSLFRDPTEAFAWRGRTYAGVGASLDGRGAVLLYEAASATNWTYAGPLWRAPPPGCRAGPTAALRVDDGRVPDLFALGGDRYALKASLGGRLRRDFVLVGTMSGDPPARAGRRAALRRRRLRPAADAAADAEFGTRLDCGGAYAAKSFTDDRGRRLSPARVPRPFSRDLGWEHEETSSPSCSVGLAWVRDAAPASLPYDGALTLPRVLTWSEACGCLLARFAPDLEALRVGEPLRGEAADQRLAFVGDGLADAAELRLAVDRPADAKNFYRCARYFESLTLPDRRLRRGPRTAPCR